MAGVTLDASGATAPGTVARPTASALSWANRWDHILARVGVRRSGHRVEPGLYALGSPDPDSPVLVSANYTLSFDALRSSLPGRDAYILVLDTGGINVWCAAGKGTFGTEELVARIEAVGLAGVVHHRTLILPQLGAPGVSEGQGRAYIYRGAVDTGLSNRPLVVLNAPSGGRFGRSTAVSSR